LKTKFRDVEPLGSHLNNDRVPDLHGVRQRTAGVAADNHINARQDFRQFNIRDIAEMAEKNDQIGLGPDFAKNAFCYFKRVSQRDSLGS